MANDVVLVAVGCLTGVLAGMLGAGGGFATVALLLAAGATPHVAVGTALVYMMVMGGWGAFMHVHLRSVDRRLALAIGAAAAISALVGAQIADILSGRDLALALALFTACVSGISLAWPQTRRPIDLPADDPVAEALDDPAAGPVVDGGAASGATAAGAAPVADAGARATAENPRPYAYGQLRDALRLRVVPPAGRPARRPPPTADAPLAGAVIGGSIIGLLKGLFGVGGAFLILPVMSR
ncbi:MAG TPA: TSUP family transporter, partial [Acidimicrobiia bacterium]|nr:TSUP family transporter [Acidimicrobiia bacterium]